MFSHFYINTYYIADTVKIIYPNLIFISPFYLPKSKEAALTRTEVKDNAKTALTIPQTIVFTHSVYLKSNPSESQPRSHQQFSDRRPASTEPQTNNFAWRRSRDWTLSLTGFFGSRGSYWDENVYNMWVESSICDVDHTNFHSSCIDTHH